MINIFKYRLLNTDFFYVIVWVLERIRLFYRFTNNKADVSNKISFISQLGVSQLRKGFEMKK